MLSRLTKIFFLIFFLPVYCFGQDADPGPGFQMMMVENPALSGSEGDGVLRLSYLNFFPGNNYNLHSVYFSYDSYFPVLHGGAGVYVADDYMGGIINDLRGGFSYAYFLQAGKNLFINAGLSASVYHRGFNFENAILPDQIDPLGGVSLPSSETLSSTGKSVFDAAAGFLFIYGKLSGGFSINHLTGDFSLNNSQSIKVKPLTYIELQSSYINGGAGAAIESKQLAINVMILGDNGKNLNIQTGFSFNTGRILLYYNYRFNALSGNKFMPLSLLHQTGLAFSLNNIEKRNTFKTINFPKL